jgi:hypothetical protein
VTEYSDEGLLNMIKEQGGDPPELQRQADEAVRERAPTAREGDLPGDRDLRKSWARLARRESRYRASRWGLSFLASLADLGAVRCAKLSGIALKTSQAGNEPTASQERPEPRSEPGGPAFMCSRTSGSSCVVITPFPWSAEAAMLLPSHAKGPGLLV